MARKASTRKSPSLPPAAATSPAPTASYSPRNKRPRPSTTSASPGVSESRVEQHAAHDDESDLSSLSDDSDDAKKDNDHDEEDDLQSDYEEVKEVKKVVKRQAGRPRKVPAPVSLPPAPAQSQSRDATRVNKLDSEAPQSASLPSPTSMQHSPPVRNLERRLSHQERPFSNPPPSRPASIQPPRQNSNTGKAPVDPRAPLLSEMYAHLSEHIEQFRIDARREESLQSTSQSYVESSILQLPTRKHRSALVLTMNRYSSFCASPAVDVPAFPITSYKIALFLARASPSRAGRLLFHFCPQPRTFPLPRAGSSDPALMGKGEGDVVTRELVKSWIEALGYAQGATSSIWADKLSHPNEVGKALLEAPHLVELLATFETLADVKRAGTAGGSDGEEKGSIDSGGEPAAKKQRTQWSKGGKVVDAPKPSGSPFSDSLSPNLMHTSPFAGPSSLPLPAAQPDVMWYPPQSQADYSYGAMANQRRDGPGYEIGGYEQESFPRGPPPAHYYQPQAHATSFSAPLPPPQQQQQQLQTPALTGESPEGPTPNLAHDHERAHEHPRSNSNANSNSDDANEGEHDGDKSASSQHTSSGESPDKADADVEPDALAMPPPDVPSKPSPQPPPPPPPTPASQWYTQQQGPLPPLSSYPPPPVPAPTQSAYPTSHAPTSSYYHAPPPPPQHHFQHQQQHSQQQGYWSSAPPPPSSSQGYYTGAPSFGPTRSYAPQPSMSYAQPSGSSYPHQQAQQQHSYTPSSAHYQSSSSSSSSAHYQPTASSSSSPYPTPNYASQQRLGIDTNLAPPSPAGYGPGLGGLGLSGYSPAGMYSPATFQREWGGYSFSPTTAGDR